MKKRASAALLALALSVSACGGDNDTSMPSVDESKDRASEVKPCDLITQAEAEAAFGAPLKDAQAQNLAVSTCVFASAAEDQKSFSDMIQLQVQPLYVFEGTKQAATDGTTLENMFKIESASGIGEEAFFQIPTTAGTDPAKATLLGFKKNDVAIYVSVSRNGLTLDQVKSAEKQLAEKAAERL